jgi:hypothetical protein
MLLSHQQTAGQNPDIEIERKLFENMSQLQFWGTTATNNKLDSLGN